VKARRAWPCSTSHTVPRPADKSYSMFAIIGIIVVFGAIVGGYLMEHGKLLVLMQPAELVIIFGAAVGTVLIANPPSVVVKMLKGVAGVFGGNKFSKAFYLENLKMLNEIFNFARKS